jgi:hypothetical protein
LDRRLIRGCLSSNIENPTEYRFEDLFLPVSLLGMIVAKSAGIQNSFIKEKHFGTKYMASAPISSPSQ